MSEAHPAAGIDRQMNDTNVHVKICGITNVEDALAACELGTQLIGINFYAKSPRYTSVEVAREIAKAVEGRATIVGVFVNADLSAVLDVARQVPLDAVQLHGDESPEYARAVAQYVPVIKAIRIGSADPSLQFQQYQDFDLLLDAQTDEFGGAGKTFDWNLVRQIGSERKLYLAGGLTVANVANAISTVRPTVVDVCSGVEASKGKKSRKKMSEFIAAVRGAGALQR